MLNLPQFLFINGPAGSGKDTLAQLIASEVPSAYIEGFAEPIRAMIYSVFFPNEGPISYSLDLRSQVVKNSFIPFEPPLAGRGYWKPSTIREEMIAFSEDHMKKRHGQMIFGQLLWERCKEQMLFSQHFLISDSGFVPEAQFIIDQVGAHNCALIKLSREGCNYSGDSRGYIDLPIQTYNLTNNGAPRDMLDALQLALGNI